MNHKEAPLLPLWPKVRQSKVYWPCSLEKGPYVHVTLEEYPVHCSYDDSFLEDENSLFFENDTTNDGARRRDGFEYDEKGNVTRIYKKRRKSKD